MAVDTPQLKLDPYQSQVQPVPLPVDMSVQSTPPARGQFTRGSGALDIGDHILKGFLRGHEYKLERKANEAKATIAAADQSTQSAYQQYQDALSGNKGKDEVDAAYKNYVDIFNRGKEAKAKFVMPEKPAKGQKKSAEKKEGEGGGGLWGGIQDFFQANPHIIPQVALTAMQPRPPGLSPESQASKMDLEAAKVKTDAEQLKLDQAKKDEVYRDTYLKGVPTFGSLTQEEIAKLPPESKQQYNDWLTAKAASAPDRKGAMSTYIDPSGNPYRAYPGEEMPGSKLYVPGMTGFKPGSYEEFATNIHRLNGIQPGQPVPPALDKWMHDAWNWKQAQVSRSSNSSTVDAAGNRTTSTSTSRGSSMPQPPSGFKIPEEFGSPSAAQGPMSAPPARRPAGSSAAPAGSMTPPPKAPTLTQVNRTMKVESQKTDRYQKAQNKYDKAVGDAQKQMDAGKIDKTEFDKRQKSAYTELNNEHGEIEKWYNGQVRAVGGTVPADLTVNGYTFPNKQAVDQFKKELQAAGIALQ